MTTFVKLFKNLSKNDVAIAGGKGASLGEMTNAGIPVPPGFVILAEAFEKFLEETDLNVEIDSILHSVNHKEIHTVEDASEKIHALILGAEMPKNIAREIQKFFKALDAKYVAVRSSATAEDSSSAAWAGQLESYLNTIEKNLLENVKKCWASLFTPRAIFYRFEKDLHKQKISVAVVVQKMVESEKSGIAFSVHPVTQDRNQLIIEAGFGLGEAIVSGQITPDSYVVEKKPRRIIDKNINTQTRCLIRTNRRIGHSTCLVGRRASSGQANEWVDIPEPKASSQVLSEKEILELSKIILAIENHYGFPVDVEWAWEKRKFYIVQSRPITTLSELKGNDVSKKIAHKHIWTKVFSRPHTIQRISFLWPYFKGGIPQNRSIQMKELLVLPSDKKYDYYIHEDEWMECLEKISEMVLNVDIIEQEKELGRIAKEWNTKLKQIHSRDLSTWKAGGLVAWFENFSASYAKFAFYAFTPWAIDFVLAPRLFENLKSLNPLKANYWFEVISTPTRHDRMMQQRIDLLKIAIGGDRNKITQHAKKYFWLPVYNLGDKPWTESDFKKHLKGIKNPKEELNKIIEDFKQRSANYAAVLKEIKPNENLKRMIEVVHLYIFLRSERVDQWRIGLCRALSFYLEIARRAGTEIDDVLNLLDEEIVFFLRTKHLPPQLKKRKSKHAILFRNGITRIFVSNDEIKNLRVKELGDTGKSRLTELRGLSAFKGIVRGNARVIREPKDLSELKKDEILVAHHTSPEYVIAMKKAAAIVTDEGGVTSHAAIVSRELKIPCVTATHDGSEDIQDGDLVEVDAERGIVRILKKAK